jgi:hypothetical protein
MTFERKAIDPGKKLFSPLLKVRSMRFGGIGLSFGAGGAKCVS